MQASYKEIYKIAAEETDISEQLYKEFGNFIFAKLYNKLKRPNTLITKLKGVGSWYLRKKRIENVVNLFPPMFKDKFDSDLELFRYENKMEIYNLFKERIKDYEEYITERNNIRKKRYETQSLLKCEEKF